MPLAPYIASFDAKLAGHRGFGGGCGLGTPVVSYAPLPMFVVDKSLRIIGKIYIKLWRWSAKWLSHIRMLSSVDFLFDIFSSFL